MENIICQVNPTQSNVWLDKFTHILGIVRTFQDNIVKEYKEMVINKEIIYLDIQLHKFSLFQDAQFSRDR